MVLNLPYHPSEPYMNHQRKVIILSSELTPYKILVIYGIILLNARLYLFQLLFDRLILLLFYVNLILLI